MFGFEIFLTNVLTRALSLQDVEGAATQTLFATLDGQVDASVYALETAPTADAFAAAQQQFAPVFSTFGDDGLKLGAEINSEANVFGLADMMLHGRGGAAAHADFAVFDSQLSGAANDFVSLGVDIASLGTIATQDDLWAVCGNLADDCAALTNDFSALSADVTPLAKDLATMGSRWGDVGAALRPLGAEYAAISNDFANMYTLYTGGSTDSAGNAIDFGGVFKSLDSDLIALDNSMHGVAAPMANAIMASMFAGGGRGC
jgi:hypothetical protein